MLDGLILLEPTMLIFPRYLSKTQACLAAACAVGPLNINVATFFCSVLYKLKLIIIFLSKIKSSSGYAATVFVGSEKLAFNVGHLNIALFDQSRTPYM
jgi:hypothetical protein